MLARLLRDLVPCVVDDRASHSRHLLEHLPRDARVRILVRVEPLLDDLVVGSGDELLVLVLLVLGVRILLLARLRASVRPGAAA
jgi:hypothetical protein